MYKWAIVVAVAATASFALADLVPIGDPFSGSSWGQRFNESGVGNFDFMAIIKVDKFGTPLLGAGFEIPAFSRFSQTGWSVNGNALTSIASRTSPSTSVDFDISFQGIKAPIKFIFFAYNGITKKECTLASWNNSWSFSTYDWNPGRGWLEGRVIPAPGAALLGVIGLGLVGWVKRRMS